MKRKGKWPWKEGRWRAFRNIPVFWMHQRTTNLDRSELVFHLTLNFLVAFTIYLLFSIAGAFSHVWSRILVSIIIARTLSWVLNDHFWGGIQVSFAFVSNRGAESFLSYLINSSERLSGFKPIYACMVYGSLVRGKFHRKSDLDILYIRRPGLMNGVLALSFALRERIIALFTQIPLDLYVGDSEKSLERYRDDEIPIIIKDGSGELFKRYQNYILLDKFTQGFASSIEKKEAKISLTNEKRRLKLCLICSVGGHFKQMLKLAPAWEDCEYFFVMFYKPVIDSFLKKERVYLVTSPERNPFLFILNIFQSLIVFLKTRPDVVISTGAGVAIAMCYIAKLFGKKVVSIEDWCIVEHPSLTGRAIYPIADLFIIQREHLKKFYPKAIFGGELF